MRKRLRPARRRVRKLACPWDTPLLQLSYGPYGEPAARQKEMPLLPRDESVRKELISDGTIDVKHFQPKQETIRKAIKITAPAGAAMQFNCYECHNPHIKARPDWNTCVTKCHSTVRDIGKHELHLQLDLTCKSCHKPHYWKVSAEQAKKECIACHEYRDPKKFLK